MPLRVIVSFSEPLRVIVGQEGKPQAVATISTHTKGVAMHDTTVLTTDQFAHIKINGFKTPGNRPAEVDGAVSVSSSDESVATIKNLVQDPDNNEKLEFDVFSADAVATGSTAFIDLTFDADLGEGVETQIDRFPFVINPARAASADATVGAPQNKP